MADHEEHRARRVMQHHPVSHSCCDTLAPHKALLCPSPRLLPRRPGPLTLLLLKSPSLASKDRRKEKLSTLWCLLILSKHHALCYFCFKNILLKVLEYSSTLIVPGRLEDLWCSIGSAWFVRVDMMSGLCSWAAQWGASLHSFLICVRLCSQGRSLERPQPSSERLTVCEQRAQTLFIPFTENLCCPRQGHLRGSTVCKRMLTCVCVHTLVCITCAHKCVLYTRAHYVHVCCICMNYICMLYMCALYVYHIHVYIIYFMCIFMCILYVCYMYVCIMHVQIMCVFYRVWIS